MKVMAGVASVRPRIDAHCTVITTAQRKKPRLHLRKSVCARARSHTIARAPTQTRAVRKKIFAHCRAHARDRRLQNNPEKTRITCTRARRRARMHRAKIFSDEQDFFARHAADPRRRAPKNFSQAGRRAALAGTGIDQKRANQREVIRGRIRFTRRVWFATDRSRPAGWPCRRMPSSPGRRTSRSLSDCSARRQPCPDVSQ